MADKKNMEKEPGSEKIFEQKTAEFIDGFSGEDRDLLKQYLQVPNKPDIAPEMTALRTQHGDKLSEITDRVEDLRQKLGVDYGVLQKTLIDQLEN